MRMSLTNPRDWLSGRNWCSLSVFATFRISGTTRNPRRVRSWSGYTIRGNASVASFTKFCLMRRSKSFLTKITRQNLTSSSTLFLWKPWQSHKKIPMWGTVSHRGSRSHKTWLRFPNVLSKSNNSMSQKASSPRRNCPSRIFWAYLISNSRN